MAQSVKAPHPTVTRRFPFRQITSANGYELGEIQAPTAYRPDYLGYADKASKRGDE